MIVEGTYGHQGLTLVATLTSEGGENDNVTLTTTDQTTVLRGHHFGVETYGGNASINIDNFRIARPGDRSAEIAP